MYTVAIAQSKVHLVSIERHDEDPYRLHLKSHLNSAILTTTELHLSDRANIQSTIVVRSEYLLDCFLPSFAYDLKMGCQLVLGCIADSQCSASSLGNAML